MANFNLGHDIAIDILDQSTGQILVTFSNFTHFESKPITKAVSSEPVNGPPLFDDVENGWDGSFEYDRASNDIEAYFANREQGYFSNGARPVATITQTIQEKNGTVTQYSYTGVALKLDSAGSWKAADKVSQKVSFKASRRRLVV
jgi:hypothetical protein